MTMTHTHQIGVLVAAVGTLASMQALAETDASGAIKSCSAQIAQVLESPRPDPGWLHAGTSESVKPYRVEMTDAKGSWEFQCDPNSGTLTSLEWVGSGDSPLQTFMTVPYEEAVAQIKNHYPDSSIKEVSYRLEAGGTAFYEFDIAMKDGKHYEVDVNAATGALTKTSTEDAQPG